MPENQQHLVKKWIGELQHQHEARGELEAEYLALTGRVMDWKTSLEQWQVLALEYDYPDVDSADFSSDTTRLQVLKWIVAQERKQGRSPGAAPPDNVPLSPSALARMFNVPDQPLRKRLERWRLTSLNGWTEVSDPGPREAKYLYYIEAVRHIVTELQASSERPARKK